MYFCFLNKFFNFSVLQILFDEILRKIGRIFLYTYIIANSWKSYSVRVIN